jgi:hypothetical protein
MVDADESQEIPEPGSAQNGSTERLTNRLAGATSPYLLQHADNPVAWQPWDEQALDRARREDKPIFLSIGYASCHWCHVMAHESFEDPETAAVLNEHFIPIKVDREERPDLDEIYMTAVQMLTGRGGWPLNIFLTPALEPFYGGTYWPKESRMGMPSFRRVLETVATAYRDRRQELDASADQIADALRRGGPGIEGETDTSLGPELIDRAVDQWRSSFDQTWGGFGGAPKFPPATPLRVLLRHHHRTNDEAVLAPVTRTLDKMACGGVYDQVGGGFHRYAVDREWLVPHFEKMLYDNALLATAYLEAYQATGERRYARVARETLDYLLRDMADPAGGFHSAQDADTEGEEGKTYVWTPDEVRAVLGEDDADLFMDFYDVTEEGNFEGANILHVTKPAEMYARMVEGDPADLRRRLAAMRQKMLEARQKRPQPGKDDKVLADWNGLALSALALGHRVLGEARHREAAERAADFILTRMRTDDGGLLHAYRDGRSHTPAFQHDYAYLVEGLVDLYEATFDPRWAREAQALADEMISRFGDPETGGFFYTEPGQEDVLVRLKRALDGARPSGNGVAAHALARLAKLTGRTPYAEQTEGVLEVFRGTAGRAPTGMASYLLALDFHLGPVREVAVVGPAGDKDTAALLAVARGTFRPRTVVAWAEPESAAEAAEAVPLLAERGLVGEQAAAYVCQDFACREPVTTPEALAEQLTP